MRNGLIMLHLTGIAVGLQNFLTEKCLPPSQIQSIDDCPDRPRETLKEYIKEALIKSEKSQKSIETFPFGFHILKRKNGKEFSNVGIWRNNELKLNKKLGEFDAIKSVCVKNCDKCIQQFDETNQQLLFAGNYLL